MQEVSIQGLENGGLQIALSGEIDLGNAEAFYNDVIAAYNASPADLCFDCTELEFIDSTTLGTFVKLLKAVKTDGYKMVLSNLQPKIRKLFVICSLDSIIELR